MKIKEVVLGALLPTLWACGSSTDGFVEEPHRAERDAALPMVADAATEGGAEEDARVDSEAEAGDAEPATGDAGRNQECIESAYADTCEGPGAGFATCVVEHEFGDGQDFGQERFPEAIFGPPEGGGPLGSLDVVSLGNGGFVVVGFEGNAVVDGPGPDFIVSENPFLVGGDPLNPFSELATVSVSEDGVDWVEWECTAVSDVDTRAPYGDCAGWRVVNTNSQNGVDPTDALLAGGDAFDLADVGLSVARFVRITDRVDTTGQYGVFDLDAVTILNGACP